ncbi:nickel pincer cofactor biosynthesis protein LarC [bacterium]|nr:nickel pincer cofactor biosynthesis protein LarC [bacterium]
MKSAYLDAFSGVSGDMMIGALIDAGADAAALEQAVGALGLRGYRIVIGRRDLSGIAAVKFDVEVSEPQPERHLGEILRMIERAGLPTRAERAAVATFRALADAEAKVHRTTPDEVHFHEVGAVDSIIDIVGAAWALDHLGVADLIVPPLPAGNGFVRSRHGIIPIPAPATAELLAGFPIRIGDGAAEMVTPTGAALVRALGRPAPAPFAFRAERVGYGAGTRTLADRPNVLRLILGEAADGFGSDDMIEISANIDDLNPQIYGHLGEQLLAAGARDVTLTPTIMKKGRPGVILSVLAEMSARDRLARMIFEETTTIGVRFHPVSRLKLDRRLEEVETRFGKIRVKVASADAAGSPLNLSPEFDDCRKAAMDHSAPLKLVMEEAIAAARRTLG